MRLGRRKREDALMSALSSLTANFTETEKRLTQRIEEIEKKIEEIMSGMDSESEKEQKAMIDDDGNYSYQKMKQRSLDRKQKKEG